MTALTLKPGELTLVELREIYFNDVSLSIDDATWALIEKAQAVVRSKVDGGDIVYGVNTGFGLLASKHIEDDLLSTLQHNLILSHATGVGKYLPDDVVKLILLLKINGLSRGVSGIRREVLELLLAMLNKGVFPAIPEKGSVGASGDLAPLAHLSLPVIGEGKVHYDGELIESNEAFEKAGLQPLKLAAKEGLALLNGTQVSTALALKGLFEAEQNINSAFVAGSLTVEAALGSRVPFHARIQAVRGQHGQVEAANIYRERLDNVCIINSKICCTNFWLLCFAAVIIDVSTGR